MDEVRLKIECPYCGHGCSIIFLTNTLGDLVCDIPCSGCDRNFLVKQKIALEVKVFKIRKKKKAKA